MGFGDLSSGAAVALVIGIDRRKSLCCFARRGEAEQPLAVRQERTGPGVLHHRRFAAGQEAQRPVAVPGVWELRARTLGVTVLAARSSDISLIGSWCAFHLAGNADAPAPPLQLTA